MKYMIMMFGDAATMMETRSPEWIGEMIEFMKTLDEDLRKSGELVVLGNTFEYTYEVTDDTLTIWGGERGSPAYYQGKFSKDGNTDSGAWVYPGGGGYESSMTRVK